MEASTTRRHSIIVVLVLVGVLAVWLGYGWLSRQFLEAVIDSRSDARAMAVMMTAVPVALFGVAVGARHEHPRLAIGLGVAGGLILLGGLLGGTGGGRDEAGRVTSDNGLHGFRGFFLVLLAVFVALTVIGIVVTRRRRAL